MFEFADFEIYDYKTFQKTIVKNQIYLEMLLINSDAFLTSYKGKSFAKLKQEMFEFVNELLL
jgi:hypothetical protein